MTGSCLRLRALAAIALVASACAACVAPDDEPARPYIAAPNGAGPGLPNVPLLPFDAGVLDPPDATPDVTTPDDAAADGRAD